uniref:Myosinlike protein putative n=1 Tax=Albugo laibachii Nc14 TaxID=890382 RepID=F0WFL4_9STRA|nr:myosinlike protein putative [Albugo laibachii Nc14]CCA23291.1 myosinlike protein putative [Albugo laibachii Nc14]|eukprot:CCA23291.1 myosinlike protein putative [Albugo laibachii Nc14]
MEGIGVYVPHDDLIWVPATILSVQANCKVFHVRLQCLESEWESVAGRRKDALTQAYHQQIKAHSTQTVDLRPLGMPDALPLQNVASTESLIGSMQRHVQRIDAAGEKDIVMVEDMCDLYHLHEPSIVYNLRQRYLKDIPYTYTGGIVVAVNPYKSISHLYTKELQDVYTVNNRSTLPPHVYATSAQAYNNMRLGREPQSILVSGESGAGKTETVKILMQHLASIDVATNALSPVPQRDAIIDMILQSNPLLEAFGNARTVKNNNSSRFGKFIQLSFNSEFHVLGANCRHYLLEKSRVIHQAPDERNFHIFYQLWSQKDPRFHWEDNLQFRYLRGTFETSDSEHFHLTNCALQTIGLSIHDRDALFEALVGILILGQLQFTEIESPSSQNLQIPLQVESLDPTGNLPSSSPSECEQLQRCASLLGFTDTLSTFSQHLCNRTFKARQEVYCIALSLDQAKYHRDALAKELYTRIFQYLVDRINQSLRSPTASHSYRQINLLDIFGFEALEINGFEQFCINYANEKLEQKLISDVFKAVEEEYRREELPWSHIAFQDNQDILDLYENPMGLLSLLNEECVRPMGSDASFASKIHSFHADNPRMERAGPKYSANHFVLHHYAQSVIYDVCDFVEKNRDGLSMHLVELLGSSRNTLIAELFSGRASDVSELSIPDAESGIMARKSSNFMQETVSFKFKTQLSELMQVISATNVQYVRCIKPNANKISGHFDIKCVIHQLRSAGIVQAIRLTREAFPNKMTHERFLVRFVLLMKRSRVKDVEGIVEACRNLGNQLIHSKSFAVGKTMIYFGKGVLEALEHQRTIFIHESARFLQKKVRHWLTKKRCTVRIAAFQAKYRGRRARKSYQKLRNGVILLQRVWRCFNVRAFRKKDRAAVVLQAFYRAQRDRRAVVQAFTMTPMQLAVEDEQHSIESELVRLEEELIQRQNDRCERDWELNSSKEATECSMLDDPNLSFGSNTQSEKELAKYRDLIEALLSENDELKAENQSIREAYSSSQSSLAMYSQQYSLQSSASLRLLSTHSALQKSQEEKMRRIQKQMADLREDLRAQKRVSAAELNARLEHQRVLLAVMEVVESAGVDEAVLCRMRALVGDLDEVNVGELSTRLRRQSEGGMMDKSVRKAVKGEEDRLGAKLVPKLHRSRSIIADWRSNSTSRTSFSNRWKKVFKRQD